MNSRGKIRTYDQVINSHLRYRCATRDQAHKRYTTEVASR